MKRIAVLFGEHAMYMLVGMQGGCDLEILPADLSLLSWRGLLEPTDQAYLSLHDD